MRLDQDVNWGQGTKFCLVGNGKMTETFMEAQLWFSGGNTRTVARS